MWYEFKGKKVNQRAKISFFSTIKACNFGRERRLRKLLFSLEKLVEWV
jgi:hypothetical protein